MAHYPSKKESNSTSNTYGPKNSNSSHSSSSTYVYVNCYARCNGRLNDPTSPFNTVDDAIVVWYDKLNRGYNGDDIIYPTNQTLVVVFDESCVQELLLARYVNITFTKATNRPLDVVVISRINASMPGVIFENVTFDSINHTVLLNPSSSQIPGTTTPSINPVEYLGVTKYTPTALLQHLADTNNPTTPVLTTTNTGITVPPSNPTLTAPNPLNNKGRYLRNTFRPANASLPNLTRLAMPLGISAATGQYLRGDNPNNNGNIPVTTNTILPRPAAVFAVIAASSALIVDSPYNLQAPGLAVRGFLNNGVLNLNFDSADFASGMVVDGPGATMIYNTPENSHGSLNVRYPELSALIAGRGSKRLLNARLNIGHSIIGTPDNDNIIAPTNDERSVRNSDNPLADNRKMFVLKNDDPNTTVNPVILNIPDPYNEISQTTINACVLTTPVFVSDILSARLVYSDLICVHILNNTNRTITGPIFSIYSSSSLVTNGSTFLLPVTIREDYTHARLDGTVFYIDAGDSDNNRVRERLGNKLECSNNGCKSKRLTIDLPGRSDWNGRLITYIRVDCSSTEVILRSDGCIEGHKPGRLCIRPYERITLHNKNGYYWAVSHTYNDNH